MTIKCVRVIVDNFERLPAHDASSGLYVCSHNGGDNSDRNQDETKDGVGGGEVDILGADASVAGQSDAVGGGGGGGDASVAGGGMGEAKTEEGEDGEGPRQKEKLREGRVIPAKFLQLISAGLSTDLDPKVGGVDMMMWDNSGGVAVNQ